MEWLKIFETKEEAIKRVGQNKPKLLVVGSTRICLVWAKNVLCAMEDKCPHNGESLSKGTVNYLGEVSCPWHGYRFDLATGRETAQRCQIGRAHV